MTTAAPIAFTRCEARYGFLWIRRAFAMFRRAPIPWLFIAFCYYAILVLLEVGPWAIVGQFLAPVLKPVFSVGFLSGAWSQERGETPRIALLFNGFRSNLYALVPLGIVFLSGAMIAVLATTLVDGGALIAVMSGREKATPELVMSGKLQAAMLAGMAAILPTIFALWFAPALVVFDDLGALRALSTSFRAALANWRALFCYGVVVFFAAGIVPTVVIGILQLANPVVGGVLMTALLAPYALGLVATLQISDYVSFRDVFHADEPSGNAQARQAG